MSPPDTRERRTRGGAGPAACAAIAAVVALSCGGPPPAVAPPVAWLSVEVLHGLSDPPGPLPQMPLHIYAFVDGSASMQAAVAGGVSREEAAHAAAMRFLGALPSAAERTLRIAPSGPGGSCREPARLDVSPGVVRGGPSPLVARLVRIARAETNGFEWGGGSAVETTATSGGATRVVLFSDFASTCAVDLCAAAEALAAAGVMFDAVVIGDGFAPACLRRVGVPPGPPALIALAEAQPPRIRVEPAPAVAEGDAAEPTEAAAGQTLDSVADGRLLPVPPGRVRIHLELEPPEEIGPLALRPDHVHRLRVLDVPSRGIRDFALDEAPRAAGPAAPAGADAP